MSRNKGSTIDKGKGESVAGISEDMNNLFGQLNKDKAHESSIGFEDGSIKPESSHKNQQSLEQEFEMDRKFGQLEDDEP